MEIFCLVTAENILVLNTTINRSDLVIPTKAAMSSHEGLGLHIAEMLSCLRDSLKNNFWCHDSSLLINVAVYLLCYFFLSYETHIE